MSDSPCNSPGKNTGVGRHSLLQGIFPTQGSNWGLPCCRQILYCLSHQGSPCLNGGSAFRTSVICECLSVPWMLLEIKIFITEQSLNFGEASLILVILSWNPLFWCLHLAWGPARIWRLLLCLSFYLSFQLYFAISCNSHPLGFVFRPHRILPTFFSRLFSRLSKTSLKWVGFSRADPFFQLNFDQESSFL